MGHHIVGLRLTASLGPRHPVLYRMTPCRAAPPPCVGERPLPTRCCSRQSRRGSTEGVDDLCVAAGRAEDSGSQIRHGIATPPSDRSPPARTLLWYHITTSTNP